MPCGLNVGVVPQVWEGEKNEANEPIGFGKATYPNEDVYEGACLS